MNKEYYEELKKEIEKFDSENISLNIIEKKNKLQKLINSKFSAYADKNISAVIAFYEYTYNKPEYNWLNEHYTKILSGYFPKTSIEKKFDSIMYDNNGLLIDVIITLCNDSVINDLISVAYEKSKQNDNYKASYKLLKDKCASIGMDVSKFLDVELSTDAKNNFAPSDLGNELINKVVNGNIESIPVNEPFKTKAPDDSLLNNHNERVNAATDKINELVKERGIDPNKKVEKPLDSTINLDNFSSNSVSDEQRAQRHTQINEKRNSILKENDKIVENAAFDLNVSKKAVYKTLEKYGLNPLYIKEGDIVISPDMVRQVAANGMINTLPQTRYVKFVDRLISYISFKLPDITVGDIDNRKKIMIKPGSKAQKIAKVEKRLLEVQRFSQNVKKHFVDTKHDAKTKIKDIMANIKSNISVKLRKVADKMVPEYDNPYDVTGRVELDYQDKKQKPLPEIYVDPIVSDPDKDNMSILEIAEGLRKGEVHALNGKFAGEIPNPMLPESVNKKM